MTPHVIPNQSRGDPLAAQIAVDGIVAEGIAMIREVRQRVVDLADQQILAVSKACYSFFHANEYTGFSPNSRPFTTIFA